MNSIDLLNDLCFERIGGSNEELKAAKLIQNAVKKLGVECVLEEFEIKRPKTKKVKLEVLEPYYMAFPVEACGNSGGSFAEIEAEILYIEEANLINLYDACGKIVMVNGRLNQVMYKNIVEAKAIGFIAVLGSFYDDLELPEYFLRPYHLEECAKIPGVVIDIKEAKRLLMMKPKKIKLTLEEEEEKFISQNVVATILGERSDEIIAFTAHYDSVKHSFGVYDNASGSIAIYELLKYFSMNKPFRTLKFIWCGTEERGLLGSKAYILKHQEELSTYHLCINIDMIGVIFGKDIAVCTSHASLVTYLEYLAKEVAFPIHVRQGVYSSDSTPFADNKVPALSFARIAMDGGASYHNRLDNKDCFDLDSFNKTINFILLFSKKMVEAKIVPVPKEIPADIVEQIDKYYYRKKK